MALATQLPRLARILEQRGVPAWPLLKAVEAANEPRHYMDVSALSPRLTLMLPARPEVLAPLAPGASLGELPPRAVMKVFISGATSRVAIGSPASILPGAAVQVAPPSGRAAWLEVVTAMHRFGQGRISSRLRFLHEPRGTIDVLYGERHADDEARFTAQLDQLAWRVGVSPAQRELAQARHAATKGAAVVVTTACTAEGPAPELAFMQGNADWDEAVRLCRLIAGEEAARGGAALFGMLASTLETDSTSGLQLQLRPDGPDVSVLVTLT